MHIKLKNSAINAQICTINEGHEEIKNVTFAVSRMSR